MTQVTKEDIARMENEDNRYYRGEGQRRVKTSKPKNHFQEGRRNRTLNLQALRGASTKDLRNQFRDEFDDDDDNY